LAVVGRYEEAERLLRQAMETNRTVLGEQNQNFATNLNNLAVLYASTNRYEEAEPLYRQVLQILLKVLGPRHPRTKTIQANDDALRRMLGTDRGG